LARSAPCIHFLRRDCHRPSPTEPRPVGAV
jgi:hypothetical protein